MDKVEIQKRIRELEKKLDEYKEKKRSAKNESNIIAVTINRIMSLSRKIDSGLDETLRKAKSISSKLDPNSKLIEKYNAKVTKILKNGSAARNARDLEVGASRGKKDAGDNENKIAFYDNKIKEIERKIDELKKEMNGSK